MGNRYDTWLDHKFGRPRSRVYVQREDNGPHVRWSVRWEDDSTLYAYAFTWWGAWRLACAAVGWKVPK